MSRLALLVLTISTSCNQWVRPTPPPASFRSADDQWDAAVQIESHCEGKIGVGTGVMVSDWQVLTALHVVDCQSAIARIRVTAVTGERWRFTPEKEWVISTPGVAERDGIARIQLASADTLRPRIRPPTVREERILLWEPLYMMAAKPERAEQIMEATGWQYGGASYGGHTLTYKGTSESGNSGSALYDINGDLVGIHLGVMTAKDNTKYGVVVTPEMVPHR